MLRRSQEQQNPLAEKIKATFYNDLVDSMLNQNDITLENIDDKMKLRIQVTIINILKDSVGLNDAVKLPTGETVTLANSPTKYIPFVKALLDLKKSFDQLIVSEIERIELNIDNNKPQSPIEFILQQFAFTIANMEDFKKMIPVVKSFILEAKDLIKAPVPVRKFDETGITPDLIRKTFYNEMVNQALVAVVNGWITYDDLESQEAYIYLALPALTILEAVNQSKNVSGIRLLQDKLLTQKNCPQQEGFAQLFTPILLKKNDITVVSEDELLLIKQLCLAKNTEIKGNITKRLTECAAVVNDIASQITQRGVFKEMIDKVIQVSLEALKEAPKNQNKK